MEKARIDPNPLYRQVKALIIGRLADGTWKPGQMLPSEPALGAEFGVSPGTVRKALDELTAENIVTRRQGRGTFAAEVDDNRILFHFFKLTGADGIRRFPDSTVTAVERAAPTPDEREALALSGNVRIIRIARTRQLGGSPIIAETITVPTRLFPDLDKLGAIPNNLYALYASRYSRTVVSAHESIRAVNADADTARALAISRGSAVLSIARTAYAISGEPVEYRLSFCRTDDVRYEVDLR